MGQSPNFPLAQRGIVPPCRCPDHAQDSYCNILHRTSLVPIPTHYRPGHKSRKSFFLTHKHRPEKDSDSHRPDFYLSRKTHTSCHSNWLAYHPRAHPPGIPSTISAACCLLPLGLGRQLFACPSTIANCIFPTHPDDRMFRYIRVL